MGYYDDNMVRDEDFAAGEAGDNGPTPPFETIGARYGIGVVSVHGGVLGEPSPPEPYLMPNFKGRNGGTERVADSPTIAPANGIMPGWGIATAEPTAAVGEGYGPDEFGANELPPFQSGISDSWPEGWPVPVR